MNKWMHRFFMYLDRYHVQHHMLPKLKEAGIAAFKRYAFDAVAPDVATALLDDIDRDR
jgi:cullin 1